MRKNGTYIAFAGGFLLFLMGRFGPGFESHFHLDDWSFTQQAKAAGSLAELIPLYFPHPQRLYGYVPLLALYRIAETPAFFTALTIITYAVILFVYAGCVWKLVPSRAMILVFSVLFVLWPNLTESFHWANLCVLLLTSHLGHALCLLTFILHLQTLRFGWLVASALLYAHGLAVYEIGAALPLAFLFLTPFWRPLTAIRLLLPFVIVAILYVVVRETNVFGWGVLNTYSQNHFQIQPSLQILIWQAGEYYSRWLGSYMLENLSNGWYLLMQSPVGMRRILLVMNVVVAVVMSALVARFISSDQEKESEQKNRWPHWQIMLFAAAWVIACWIPMSVAHSAPRMMFLPAFGASLAIVGIMNLLGLRYVPVILGVWCFIALGANQGTNLAWQETGRYNDQVLQQIQLSKADWESKDVVLIDSSALRERLASPLVQKARHDPEALSKYYNSTFMRGFYFTSMFKISAPDMVNPPTPVLDIECDAKWIGDVLYWHVRFDPENKRQTPRNMVYVMHLPPTK